MPAYKESRWSVMISGFFIFWESLGKSHHVGAIQPACLAIRVTMGYWIFCLFVQSQSLSQQAENEYLFLGSHLLMARYFHGVRIPSDLEISRSWATRGVDMRIADSFRWGLSRPIWVPLSLLIYKTIESYILVR